VEWSHLEVLFESVKAVFAPNGGYSYKGIVYRWNRIRTINGWLQKPTDAYYREKLPAIVADFLEWLTSERPDKQDIKQQLNSLLRQQPFEEAFRIYCEMQRELMRARLLSGSEVTQYDLIHIIENYDYHLLDREAFQRATGESPPKQALCVQLRRHRQQRLRVSFRWNPPRLQHRNWSFADFQRCFVSGEPVALKGLQLRADEPVPPELYGLFADQYVSALLVPDALRGVLYRITEHRSVFKLKALRDQ